jgi:anti-sigma B factor antagonist
MILESENIGDITYVKVQIERLDAARCVSFKEEIKEMISKGGHSIVLDFSTVKFMDSSGLGAVVSVLKMLTGKRELVLCGVKGMVLDLFKLTRMDRVFMMTETKEDAIQKLAH